MAGRFELLAVTRFGQGLGYAPDHLGLAEQRPALIFTLRQLGQLQAHLQAAAA